MLRPVTETSRSLERKGYKEKHHGELPVAFMFLGGDRRASRVAVRAAGRGGRPASSRRAQAM